MQSDFEIGRVVAVDTAQVTLQLNADLKGLTRTTYEGPQEIARINSYVILPVGGHRLVGMVNRVVLAEEAEVAPSRTMVTLPSAKRMVKATLIGTIDGASFTQGISLFPVLDNPVHLVSDSDLTAIFGGERGDDASPADPNQPGFCIHVGSSAIFERLPIKIDPDAAFGKHLAVLGSTGSGKSCTIASILQAILDQRALRQTHFIILDTNGEYRSAFERGGDTDRQQQTGRSGALYIPSGATDSRLIIPYWFMNADDYVRIFRAKEGLQAPVLLRALRLSRAQHAGPSAASCVLDVLRTACAQILAHTENTAPAQQWAVPKNIHEACQDGLRYRAAYPQNVSTFDQRYGAGSFDRWEGAIQAIKVIVEEVYRPGQAQQNQAVGATRLQRIRDSLDPLITFLNECGAQMSAAQPDVTADQPSFFDRSAFLEKSLDIAMREQAESSSPGRIREACGPMFVRIRRFFEDPRFDFLFGLHPKAVNVLAAFIRDVLGLPSGANTVTAPPMEDVKHRLPFYERQQAGSTGNNVVILDLSLLASEVLENVTALIGRLILEFLQRLGEHGGEEARGSLPTVLVLEEAQNYIREQRFGDEESISRSVFERIAREGRKYGLGLVVASQRPSELSKTVLSQCNSFIVHRLQNPEDLRYFREIVPGIYGPLLDQLPALAPQTALILGTCVRAPALVRIRDCQPLPRSRDPKFYKHWVDAQPADVPVEQVCAKWEGQRVAADGNEGPPVVGHEARRSV